METTNNDTETTQENTAIEETIVTESPKLYAGKYKSVEELEKAYKSSAGVFNENKTLKEQLKSFEVPENYSLPESLSLHEQEIQGLQNIAKTAGLNQEQFNKTLLKMQEQQQQCQIQLEERKKMLGDTLNVIEDYVTKIYPSTLHSTILNTLIGDENAMSEALKHRNQILNSQVPGLGSQRANLFDPTDGKEELANIAKEFRKNPSEKNRKRYINLANEVAEARSKK